MAKKSAHDAPFVAWTRGVAVVGLGLTAGYMSSISISSMKNIYRVPTLSPRDRLHLWSLTFDSGAALMKPTLPFLTALLATSAYYAVKPALYVPHNWIASHRQAVLAVTSALTFFNFPWTFLVIIPIVKKLKAIESKIVKESKEGDAISTGDTDYDIQRWTKLHHVRSIACTLAFTLSVLELVSA
ncbi:BQ2448_4895 [Microbotryum intermedium]|uniref:BQ2448_4895 protein n=1 Tax=Microbotryum intermedium TaxID=269621 RepID=A0A238FJ69_9BASI|nr:BQ2448_4895 [Microbotryum intermedium]